MDPTPAQLAARTRDAGLSSAQAAGVAAGTGYTPSNPSISYYTPPPAAAPASAPAPVYVPPATQQPALPQPVSGSAAPTPYDPTSSTYSPTGKDIFGVPVAPGTPVGSPADSTDTAYKDAMTNLSPTTAPNEDDFFASLQKKFQPVLDSIQQAEFAAESAATQGANRVADKATSAQNFSMNAQGLAGSSEAGAMAGNIEADRSNTIAAAVAQAKQVQSQALSTVTQFISSAAHGEFQDALTRNDSNSAAYIGMKQKQAQNALKGIATTGVPLDQFQQTHPEEYAGILQYYNGDHNALAADYLANIPAPQMLNGGNPITTNGNNAVYSYIDPITKQLKFQSVESPVPFAQNNDAKVGAGVGVVVYNKDTGEAKVIGGTANPTYLQNQQLTTQQKQASIERTTQLLENSKALEANRLIGSQIKTDARIKNFLSISPAMARIKASQQQIETEGVNPANLGDLVEAVTQVNSGGGQITEGKLSLIKDSQSYWSQFQQLWQKADGSGGAVSKQTADQMIDLSNKIFGLYEGEYKKAADQYTARLKNVNGQDLTSYSPLTDITQLPSVLDGTYGSALEATQSAAPTDATTSATNTSQITALGFSDNGDGTFTNPQDGTTLIDNGDGTFSEQ